MASSSSPPAEVLRNTALFSGLTESEIQGLARRTTGRACAVGEILFSEGQPCAGLYVVIKGRVRIFKTSQSGREQVLAIDGPTRRRSVSTIPRLR